jgi:hypothetical protein
VPYTPYELEIVTESSTHTDDWSIKGTVTTELALSIGIFYFKSDLGDSELNEKGQWRDAKDVIRANA